MNIARQFHVDVAGPSFTLCQDGIICIRAGTKLLLHDYKTFALLRYVDTVFFTFGVLFRRYNQIIEISNDVYSYNVETLERTTVYHLKSQLQSYFSCEDQMFAVFDNKLHFYYISSNQFEFILDVPYAFSRGITTRRGDELTISQLQLHDTLQPYSIRIDMADQSVLAVPPITLGICGDVVRYGNGYATIGSRLPGEPESSVIYSESTYLELLHPVSQCGGTVLGGILYITDQCGEVYEVMGQFIDQERAQLLIVKSMDISSGIEYLENRNSREKALIRRVQELMHRLKLYREGRIEKSCGGACAADRSTFYATASATKLLRSAAEYQAQILELQAKIRALKGEK